MTITEILNSSFNLELHKKTFINYLEVVISPKGTIYYATPSHNAALERVLMNMLKINIKELWQLCPKEYQYNYNEWLCFKSGYIMVWGKPNSFIVGVPNEKQQETLEMLKKEGLY